MMKPVKDNDIQSVLRKMPLFDSSFINGEKALYFDDKHNAKRLRSALISDKRGCKVNGTVISNDQLKHVFTKAGIKNIKSMLEPSDKQNVPAVLRLYEALEESILFCENSTDQVLRELINPIKIVHDIYDGIISVFSDPTINFDTQLIKLSKLAHILLHEYKAFGTGFLPGQLYHDLQRMIQGCYYACSLQKRRGRGRLYLYQLGTDQVERLFSLVRTITHARNCDSLELCQRLSHAESLEVIISKRPTWKIMHGKRLCGNKDASSQREWKGNLEVDDCDVPMLWHMGRMEAVKTLNIPATYFTNLQDSGITMMRPNKRLVGVNVDNEREELSSAFSETEELDEDNSASLEIEEMLQDVDAFDTEQQNSVKVEVDGEMVYKATVVKEILNGDDQFSSTIG